MRCAIIVKQVIAGCSAAGSALDWGSRGRGFKSRHSDHVAADDISFAATFFVKKSLLSHAVAAPFPNPNCFAGLGFGAGRNFILLPRLWYDTDKRNDADITRHEYLSETKHQQNHSTAKENHV